MELIKKDWNKPELIVLVRSRPEEAVLTHCKAQLEGSRGAIQATQIHGCSSGTVGNCQNCQARADKGT